ncbi:MAG: ribonuclease Z [Bacteroidota bacterium]|nr:ribonuclease Z [Bacteroidota bacterium]MDE2834094.1 ribonuclease Z [Bacteroidota bacterium]
MEFIPLGTAAGKPLHGRHLPSMALVMSGRIVLFDCGEAAQLQMHKVRLRTSRVETICITHLHGDHFYGLPGLISTMALNNRHRPLTIIAPAELRGILEHLPGTRSHERSFDIELIPLTDGTHGQVFQSDRYTLLTSPLEHRTDTFGYRLEQAADPPGLDGARAQALGVSEPAEFRALSQGHRVTTAPGRTIKPEEVLRSPQPAPSFAYVSDTRPCPGGLELARRATLLVHEATYLHNLLPKAISTKHSTALEAAELAREADAQALVVCHYSSRYQDPSVLADEARTAFAHSDWARELERYPVAVHSRQQAA